MTVGTAGSSQGALRTTACSSAQPSANTSHDNFSLTFNLPRPSFPFCIIHAGYFYFYKRHTRNLKRMLMFVSIVAMFFQFGPCLLRLYYMCLVGSSSYCFNKNETLEIFFRYFGPIVYICSSIFFFGPPLKIVSIEGSSTCGAVPVHY